MIFRARFAVLPDKPWATAIENAIVRKEREEDVGEESFLLLTQSTSQCTDVTTGQHD